MMLLSNLRTGEVQVMIHHFESAVAEDLPEREYVTTIQQVVNGKCMPA